ncbi:MAG: ABC transporter permease [Planctomycetota bacterium]
MTDGQTPEIQLSRKVARRAKPTSWVARIVLDTAGRTGAKLGLAWVVTMICMAVFAPFIANSHPYRWVVDGKVSYPLFTHLSWQDLSLLVMLLSGLVALLIRGLAFGKKMVIFVWLTGTAVFAQTIAPTLRLVGQLSGPDSVAGSDGSLAITGALLAPLLSFIALGYVFYRLIRRQAWPWLGGLALGGLILGLTLGFRDQPPDPDSVIYSQYREALAAETADSAVFAPIAYSPGDFQRDNIAYAMLQPPTWDHPMGTSAEGADVASRMLYATRVALIIGFIATGIALVIGVIIGGMMGYFSGIIDLLGMRLVEIFSAIPVIFLLILICAVYERNIYLMMIVIGLTGWVGYAIFIRAEFLKLRSMDYVMAARAAGTPIAGILFRHLLPNGVAPVLVLASFGFASAILFESSLSFLGLGLPPQDPSWGQLLQEARANGGGQWWLVLYPGLAIFLTVFAYNLIGEAMRDALDPRTAK